MPLKIVAGNWKMNLLFHEAEALIREVIEKSPDNENAPLNIFAVPFPYLNLAQNLTQGTKNFAAAAQNCSSFKSGAYTGEVSASMLASLNIKYCLVGHSERRTIFKENADELVAKMNLLLENHIIPIWCCGESLNERKQNKQFDVIQHQMNTEVFTLTQDLFEKVVIAYEPVWAIGTGLSATAEQAQEIHSFIRKSISKKYSDDTANKTSILYGGSCNVDNSKELFSLKDVDGGLIGGASLKSDSFVKIISTMHELL